MPERRIQPETRDLALEMIGEGRLIDAIKLVREATGLELKEASDYINRLRVESLALTVPAEVDAEARRLVATGRRRDAAKLLRERGSLDRSEARAYVAAVRSGKVDPRPRAATSATGTGAAPEGAGTARAPLSERVRAFEAAGDHDSAVALVRAETGMTRDEAERFVNALD